MKKYIILGLVAFAVITLTGCSTTKTDTSAADTQSAETASSYKDGEYDATGNYTSPGGTEEIEVKITLKDNVVTDTEAIAKATRPESQKYQALFVEGFKSQVIGKNINDVKLTKVSGSSRTPIGFNDAIEKIKAEAQI